MSTVLFLRGLNTYADDLQHLGPLTFGPISQPLTAGLHKRGVELVTVHGIGTGSLTQQIQNAKHALPKSTFHLLGHSLGGLLARALASDDEIGPQVKSVTTIATPHRGAAIATAAHALHHSRPLLYQLLKVLRYDTKIRSLGFKDLSCESLSIFNQQTQARPGVLYQSVECALEPRQRALPYRALRLLGSAVDEPSDGMISLASQSYQRRLGRYALDHLMAIGFCFDFRPSVRRHFHSEFNRLADDLARFYLDFS